MHSGHKENCVFCGIVAGTIPCFKVYEDDRTIAFMDINPVNPGHCLIISKTHAADLMQSADEDLAAILPVVKRMAHAVSEELKPDGINIHQANGPGAAQSVHHYHMHVVPRRMDDELIMNWPLVAGDKSEIQAVAERLRARLRFQTVDAPVTP